MNKITSFVSKYWKHPIAIGIYILIAIIIVYYWGKGKGSIKPNPLPTDTGWGANLTPTQATNIRAISQRLHRDMTDYWVSSGFKDRDIEVYKQFLNLSDTEFVGVYNDFNDLYFEEGDGTLTEWIDDESFTFTAGASGDLRETIIMRLQKQNLK